VTGQTQHIGEVPPALKIDSRFMSSPPLSFCPVKNYGDGFRSLEKQVLLVLAYLSEKFEVHPLTPSKNFVNQASFCLTLLLFELASIKKIISPLLIGVENSFIISPAQSFSATLPPANSLW